MILFLYGDDSYRIAQRATFLRDAFKEKYDAQGINVAAMDCGNFDIDELRKHIKSSGLFAQKRFITIKNMWSLSAEEQTAFGNELQAADEDTIICISAKQPPRKNNALFKWLLKNSSAEEYSELPSNQLRTFIAQEAKTYGATITDDAVQYLIRHVGTDLWRMHNEVKILAHQSSEITKEMAEQAVDNVLDDNIFHLTDALGSRNTALALSLLEQQLEIGANEQYLHTMISKQVGTLLKVKESDGEGLKMHPYVLKKSTAQANQFELVQLKKMYWDLLELDEKMKTTNASARTLLELFIVEATQ